MPIVEVQGLNKRFGSVQALRGLNLKLSKGVIGLIGPNGAGKTTTIGILLGLLRPDGGKAQVFGFDCWHNSFEVRKRAGVLHEKPVYPGGFTGRRYLEYVAKFYGAADPRGRAAEMLKMVGFSEAADRNIGTYSAGMVQRIGLAQALIGEPELVILDEPTANLDPIGRVEFLEMIRELHHDRRTSFIISTHILTELETVCDQVAIICGGVVIEQGKIEELAEKHAAGGFTIVVSDPQVMADEIKKAGFAKEVKVEAGGKVTVQTDDRHRLQNEVIRTVKKHKLELMALGPTYGLLEAVYRRAMEERND
jgi:ABC-type multidrug transport system ATPase subunit